MFFKSEKNVKYVFSNSGVGKTLHLTLNIFAIQFLVSIRDGPDSDISQIPPLILQGSKSPKFVLCFRPQK